MTPSGSRGETKEGESMRALERAVGKGKGVLIQGNQEGICRHDFEGGGGGGVGSQHKGLYYNT